MKTISESQLGERFGEVLDGVAAGAEEVVVSRAAGSVVIVSLAH